MIIELFQVLQVKLINLIVKFTFFLITGKINHVRTGTKSIG